MSFNHFQKDLVWTKAVTEPKQKLKDLFPHHLLDKVEVVQGDWVDIYIRRNRDDSTIDKMGQDLSYMQRRNSELKALIRRQKKLIRAAKKGAKKKCWIATVKRLMFRQLPPRRT